MAITYNNLYLDIRTRLRAAGVEMATLEARELTCFAAGKTREELYRDGALYASPAIEARARELVERHLAGGRVKVYDPMVERDLVPNQYHDFDAFLRDVDLVVILVGHSHLKAHMEQLRGKVVLDTRHVCGLEGTHTL